MDYPRTKYRADADGQLEAVLCNDKEHEKEMRKDGELYDNPMEAGFYTAPSLEQLAESQRAAKKEAAKAKGKK